MKAYIKKFCAILIVWALVFDSSTVMVVYAIKNNTMNKAAAVQVDEDTRQAIEENNLQRLADDKQSEAIVEKPTSINEPIITNQDSNEETIEDVSKRTLHSRTIMNEDGKYRVEQAIYPMFKQVAGALVDIDNDFINQQSDGLYTNALSLDKQVIMNLENVNKSKLGIIFESDNQNKSAIAKNVAKIMQDSNDSDYEIVNEDYLVKVAVQVKESADQLTYELQNVANFSISEGVITINNGEYTILPIYFNDKLLESSIVEQDNKKYLTIDTSDIVEDNFIVDIKVGVNPLKSKQSN